jgi:death-on-curing protein
VTDWIWIDPDVLLAAHDEQLEEHGGATSIGDRGLFDSALARPRNLSIYGDPGDAALAASYAFGLVRNHPFVDGNKRTGFVALELFLVLNGFELTANDAQCVLVMLSVAAGSFSETELAEWIQRNIKPV